MAEYANPRTHIVDWLNKLALIVPKAMELTDLAAKIDQLADLLVSKVPPTMFDADTLEFCARKFKFWPSYAELWARLQTWERERPKPKPRLIESEVDHSGLTEEQKAQARYWFSHKAQQFKHLADKFPDMRSRMAQSLSVLKRYNEPVFRYVCHTDPDAAAIAVQRGWRVDPEPPATPEERAASLAKAHDAQNALQARNTRIDYAAIDKQAAERNKQAREEQIKRDTARPLTGEALRQAREAAGIKVPVAENGSSPPPETPRTSDACSTCEGTGKTRAFVDFIDPKTKRRRGEAMDVPCMSCGGSGKQTPPANDTDRWVPDWEDADA